MELVSWLVTCLLLKLKIFEKLESYSYEYHTERFDAEIRSVIWQHIPYISYNMFHFL
jgi:hypothetical protein